MSIDLSHASPPSGITVEAVPETVADFVVVVDVLDRLWPQLLATFARQDVRIAMTIAAVRTAAGMPEPELTAELQTALRNAGVGRFELDPADALTLSFHMREAAQYGPDPCDIRLSDGSPCDGWAAQCARHGEVDR